MAGSTLSLPRWSDQSTKFLLLVAALLACFVLTDIFKSSKRRNVSSYVVNGDKKGLSSQGLVPDAAMATSSKLEWAKVVLRHLRIPVDETWGGHNIVLLASLYATRGPILELGSGFYSTPLIHNVAAEMGRYVLTAEANSEWLQRFLILTNPDHEFAFVDIPNYPTVPFPHSLPRPAYYKDWDGVGINEDWGMIFVDRSPPGGRMDDLRRLRENSDLFVVHDTNPEWFAHDRLLDVAETFPHKLHFLERDIAKSGTDAWSMNNPGLIRKVKKLVCWTLEIIDKTPMPLDDSRC